MQHNSPTVARYRKSLVVATSDELWIKTSLSRPFWRLSWHIFLIAPLKASFMARLEVSRHLKRSLWRDMYNIVKIHIPANPVLSGPEIR
jgi:hypothetical protein